MTDHIPCVDDDPNIRHVEVHELLNGDVLIDDVLSVAGTLLCTKGQEVTTSIRTSLMNYARNVGIRKPIRVRVPSITIYPGQVSDQAVSSPRSPKNRHAHRIAKTSETLLKQKARS
jgi:hypothetical protein